MINQTKMRRQFGLRSLFITVTVAAVLCAIIPAKDVHILVGGAGVLLGMLLGHWFARKWLYQEVLGQAFGFCACMVIVSVYAVIVRMSYGLDPLPLWTLRYLARLGVNVYMMTLMMFCIPYWVGRIWYFTWSKICSRQ